MQYRRLLILIVSTLGVVFVGCSSDSGGGSPRVVIGGDTGDAGDAADEVTLPDASRELDGPEVQEFSVSPQRLTEGGAVSITATLTDPQGFEDIGGGRILDEDGETYGVLSGSGGTYSATLSWEQINAVAPITFDSEQQRVFIAEFFDSDNHRSTQPFLLALHCDGDSACDGSCGHGICTEECTQDGISCELGSCVDPTELNDVDHCGTCGNACGEGFECDLGECLCEGSKTTCGSACVDTDTDVNNCGACGNSCGEGFECDGGECICGNGKRTCGNACVDTDWDSNNCGGCGDVCRDGTGCYYEECVDPRGTFFPCSDDEECPGGQCDFEFGCIIQCGETRPCVGDNACGSLGEGLNVCLAPCDSDADCPDDLECVDSDSGEGFCLSTQQ